VLEYNVLETSSRLFIDIIKPRPKLNVTKVNIFQRLLNIVLDPRRVAVAELSNRSAV